MSSVSISSRGFKETITRSSLGVTFTFTVRTVFNAWFIVVA